MKNFPTLIGNIMALIVAACIGTVIVALTLRVLKFIITGS